MHIEEEIGALLKEKHLTMATAESCTGGGIAALVTSVSGSSSYFNGGIVAYQNEVKEQILKVNAETIEKYNVVSAQTVEEMAKGAMKALHADCAVATSGIAGPTGGDEERPVGTIWIAAAYADKVVTMKQEGDQGRAKNIERAIKNALSLLAKLIKE
ncbi:MAG: CinA family protein [Bacteroidaceae bacterium]|nr:CinA family protein [Bacteroidaceae bacterium]